MNNYIFYIEHLVGGIGGEWVEYEYKIEIADFEPYVPAKISGPPENCYPAEGAEVTSGEVQRRLASDPKAPWENVSWAGMLEMYIAENYVGPERDQDAMDAANEAVYQGMVEFCEQAQIDAQDAYDEDAAEAARDRAENFYDERD